MCKQTLRNVVLGVLMLPLLLAGCASSDKIEPADLVDFDSELRVRTLWRAQIGAGFEEKFSRLTPVLSRGLLFAADAEGRVYALEQETGARQWRTHIGTEISGGVGAGAGQVYVGTFKGELVALDAIDGSINWRAKLSTEVVAAPQTNGELVVAQTIDGKLFALDTENGEQRWVFDSAVPLLTLRGTSTPMINDEVTFVAFANGELIVVENENGTAVWRRPVSLAQGRTELERLADVDGRFLIDDNTLYAVGFNGKLVALEQFSGRELWNKDISSFVGPALGYNNVYVIDEDDYVVAYDTGSRDERWSNEEMELRRLTTPVALGETLVVGDFEGYLHFLSQVDGRFLERKRVGGGPFRSNLLVDDDVLYALNSDGTLRALTVERR